MKPVPQMLPLDWILTSWKSLPKEMVACLFKNCALPIDENGE